MNQNPHGYPQQPGPPAGYPQPQPGQPQHGQPQHQYGGAPQQPPGQPGAGYPPPHGAYGAPPQPGMHPGQAPGYGAPPPGAYAAPMADPRIKELNDQSTTWLIVSIVGFWLGFGFVTGPLSWLKANSIRRNYRNMGMQPSGTSTAAMIVGMVSSLVYVFAVLAVVMMFTLFAGAVAAGA